MVHVKLPPLLPTQMVQLNLQRHHKKSWIERCFAVLCLCLQFFTWDFHPFSSETADNKNARAASHSTTKDRKDGRWDSLVKRTDIFHLFRPGVKEWMARVEAECDPRFVFISSGNIQSHHIKNWRQTKAFLDHSKLTRYRYTEIW